MKVDAGGDFARLPIRATKRFSAAVPANYAPLPVASAGCLPRSARRVCRCCGSPSRLRRTSRPAHSLILSSQEPSPCGGTPIRIRTGNCRSASAIMNPELAEMENEEFVNILRQQIRGLENQKVQLTAKLTEVSNRLTHAKKLMEAYVPELPIALPAPMPENRPEIGKTTAIITATMKFLQKITRR